MKSDLQNKNKHCPKTFETVKINWTDFKNNPDAYKLYHSFKQFELKQLLSSFTASISSTIVRVDVKRNVVIYHILTNPKAPTVGQLWRWMRSLTCRWQSCPDFLFSGRRDEIPRFSVTAENVTNREADYFKYFFLSFLGFLALCSHTFPNYYRSLITISVSENRLTVSSFGLST